MQLNPAAFDAMLEDFAEPMLWRKSNACPCLNPKSGAPDPKCPVCSGKGRIWGAATPTSSAVASSSSQQQWAKNGLYQQGDLVLSIPQSSALYDITQYDRVVQLTSTDDFSLPLVRGAPTERLHGRVKEITRVFWLNGSTAVEGSIPTVADDGTITFPGSGAPPAEKTYSISGNRYAEYFCFGPFSNDRMKHGGLRLPRKMVMRKFDLFGRGP